MNGWRWLSLSLLLFSCGPQLDDASSIELAFIRSTVGDPRSQIVGAVPGESVVPLWASDTLGDPSGLDWSFDGQHIAFTTGVGRIKDLAVFSIEAGATTVFPYMHDARWSPTALEFIAQRSLEDDVHVADLILVDLDTETGRVLGRGSIRSYSWAPDGERFVLAGALDEHAVDRSLVIVERDGTASAPVLQLPSDIARLTPHEVAWSPLGDMIALSAGAGGPEYSRLFTLDLSDNTVAMWPGDRYGYGDPVWSPDGARVAADTWVFDAVQRNDSGIVVFDVSARSISATELGATALAWSADGRSAMSRWVDGADDSQHVVVVQDTDGEWISTGGDSRFSDGGAAWRPPAP